MGFNYRTALITVLLFFVAFVGAVYTVRTVSGTNIPVAAVQSGSMEPNIPTGSLIFVRAVDPSEIVAGPPPVGDIVVYIQQGTEITDYFIFTTYDPLPISHRVIDKTQVGGTYYFLTKGDANSYPDQSPSNPLSWVPEDRIVGKVVFSVPYLGYPFLFKNTWIVSIVLLIIIVLIALPSKDKEPAKPEGTSGSDPSTGELPYPEG
ncbi:MAG: signal peptidase I [Candidatus Methanosuratus sp.]|nr:signal peptidase I [Candidatus Methanosuratincola sp.]